MQNTDITTTQTIYVDCGETIILEDVKEEIYI